MAMSLTAPNLRRSLPGVAVAAFFAGATIFVLFLVSNLFLMDLGVAYESEGGAQWQKIHPATYLALIAVALLAVARLNPIEFLDDVVRHNKGTLVFLTLWAVLLAHIALVLHAPITLIVDTFLLPIALLLIIGRLQEYEARRIAIFLHVVMAANAFIGIGEFIVGLRLTPLVAEGVVLTGDWRSTAILGHPLQNAAITAVYALILLRGGGQDMPTWLRPFAVLLQIAAMAVFGGRAATVLFALFGAAICSWQLLEAVRTRRLNMGAVAGAAALATTILVSVVLLAGLGYFDRFLDRFVDDQGSASARIAMFRLFEQIPFPSLLIGPDPELVSSLQRLEGIQFGIESFWIAFLINYGFLLAIPFFVGFLFFLRDVARASRAGSILVILYFVIVSSTSASLSGKTTVLGMFVTLLLILLRPLPPPRQRHIVAPPVL